MGVEGSGYRWFPVEDISSRPPRHRDNTRRTSAYAALYSAQSLSPLLLKCAAGSLRLVGQLPSSESSHPHSTTGETLSCLATLRSPSDEKTRRIDARAFPFEGWVTVAKSGREEVLVEGCDGENGVDEEGEEGGRDALGRRVEVDGVREAMCGGCRALPGDCREVGEP